MREFNIIDKNFNKKYSIPEFADIRKKLLIILSKTIIFLFKTTLIKDYNITVRVIALLQPYLGNDLFNSKYLSFDKSLKKIINSSKNEITKKKYVTRYY